jgi:cytochrome c oxidase subunit I
MLSPARAWTLVACLAFIFATLYAVAVVVLRLPFLVGDYGHLFRTALVLHVELAVFVWLMATMAGQWAAARGGAASNWPPALAAVGTMLLALSPLAAGTPVMADYFPWLDGNHLFTIGFGIFCCAVAASAIDVLRGRLRREWHGVEFAAWPSLAAAVTLFADMMNGATQPVQLAWGAGHVLLFAHVIVLCRDWSALAGTTPRYQRQAFLGLAVIAALTSLLPFVVAPGTSAHGPAFTFAMAWLLWPLPVVFGAWATWRVWADRRTGPLPRLSVSVSFALLLLGCLLGAAIDAPTTLVTAHYHAAIGAVAISRMSVAYLNASETAFVVPNWRAMQRQLVTYTLGLVLLAAGLSIAAIEGAPRKTSAAELRVKGPYFAVGMSISGVGGLMATLGAGWLVINLVRRPRAVAPVPG